MLWIHSSDHKEQNHDSSFSFFFTSETPLDFVLHAMKVLISCRIDCLATHGTSTRCQHDFDIYYILNFAKVDVPSNSEVNIPS